MQKLPLKPSASQKIFELHQYFEVGNHDYACNQYFSSKNLRSAEKEAREWLATDWDEDMAQAWSLKNRNLRDSEGRSLYATLIEVQDIYSHLDIEKARPDVRIIVSGGVVQDVQGLKTYDLLDYDAVQAGDISAKDIIKSGKLKEISSAREEKILKKMPHGKQLYTCIPDNGSFFLVVGPRTEDRFALFLGRDLGWEVGTTFPYNS